MARHLMLDIRNMEPPEPLDRVLTTIADFRAGDTLKVLPTSSRRRCTASSNGRVRASTEPGDDAPLRSDDLGARVSGH